MSTEAPGAPAARRLLRDRADGNRVTNIELFFDLVYVFAVTQLSHRLLADPTVRGALQSALLLAMIWMVGPTRRGSRTGWTPTGSRSVCCSSCSC